MFPSRFFPNRMFAARYFPKFGAASVIASIQGFAKLIVNPIYNARLETTVDLTPDVGANGQGNATLGEIQRTGVVLQEIP